MGSGGRGTGWWPGGGGMVGGFNMVCGPAGESVNQGSSVQWGHSEL